MSTDTPPPDAPTEPETLASAASTADRYLAVQRSDEFAGLRRALRGFIFPMTVAFFLWYALYVILSAYARDFMGTRLFGSNINIALIFGLLQFVSTFLIAWLYSRFADRKIDPIADRIRAEMGEVTHGDGPRG
ncbi:DUF485 domain-containing protein [Micromonospora carbonacea]|uniref:Uncharacterized membrane protein, DUF485 family n=1 Tax=Micromonospora carbonacea TaxID=47853 RepID=A0A1C5AQJ4_9ACTN|nr:DUF485 domain-containing protein [Micromonospora carbonacea]SCF47341.1 Uncharacterized membrane protein, DUF485 family [Micromonospora carbonacea]